MKRKSFVLIGCFFFLPTFTVFAGLFLRDLDPPKTFLFQSPYYTLKAIEPLSEEPGFLKFKVSVVHAPYEIEGLVPLRKTLHEIEVIERIRREEDGSGFVAGAVDSMKATGAGFVHLIVHPIKSAQAVGEAVGKLGGSIGGLFREKEEGEKTTWGEKVLGRTERELAKQFGVDVYTTNPHMQELLRGMAKARLSGKGASAIGKLLIPVAGLVAVTLTASGINSAADQFVNDQSRVDLFHSNQDALMQMGFSPEETNRFLNLPYYSPREATYIRFYLEKLRAVEGYRKILKRAVESRSLWEARKILYASQMAADSKEIAAFRKIEWLEEGLAVYQSNRVILITPYDYLDQSALGNRVVDRVLQLQRSAGRSFAEIWNGGRVTPPLFSQAFLKGIKVRSWLLFI